MTVVDFVRLTRANLRIIFVMFSLGLLVAFVYTARQPVVYTATAKGSVRVAGGTSVSEQFASDNLAQTRVPGYVDLAGSTRVAATVKKELGLDQSPEAIAASFTAVGETTTPSLTVFARSGSPKEARDLANAAIGAMSREAERQDTVARPEGAPVVSLVKLVPNEQATLPSRPTSPDYPVNLGVGGLVGILLGYGVSLARRQLDSRIRTVEDIESLVGTSVLSILPETQELDRVADRGIVSSQTGPAAEALRQLRTNLRFVDVDNPPRSIVITSANAGEGKSVVGTNLAWVLAAAGQKTVLIDGDLRRPMVADIFDLDPAIGLTQVLAGDLALEQTVQDPGLPNLRVITAGRIPPNPSELLGSLRMQHVIEELVGQGYFVLIDAPPLLPVTDAGLLSATVDGAILVLALGRTYKEQAKLAAKVVDQVGGHVLGSVLNRAAMRGIGSVVYGYGYATYAQDYYSAYVYGGGRTRLSRRQQRLAARRMQKMSTEPGSSEEGRRGRRPTGDTDTAPVRRPAAVKSVAGKRRAS